MNKFEDLQAFVAVVESGSFTAAAERLNADKSAVSRRVSALEDRLGAQLLRRTTRTLTITDTGNSFTNARLAFSRTSMRPNRRLYRNTES